MDLARVVDLNNEGILRPLNLKIIFTYLSELPTIEKWKKILQLYPSRENSEGIEVSKAWDVIYFWSSTLLKDYAEVLENKYLIIEKLKGYAGGRKTISDEELLHKILELAETSYFAYFLKELDYIKEKKEFSAVVKQIKEEEEMKIAHSNLEEDSNYKHDISEIQNTPSDNLSLSSDDEGRNEKITESREFDENEVFFEDACNAAPKGKDTEEENLRECFKNCSIF